MKYACLVYPDPGKLAGLSETEQLAAILAECESASAWNAEMVKRDHHVFTGQLQSVNTATTIRKSDGKLFLTDGPFAETKEFLGGITIIEARGMNEAVELASKLASELITVEVRPIMDANAELTDPLDQKIVATLRQQP